MSAKLMPRSRLKAFLALPENALVRIYSSQETEALERIMEHGYLSGPTRENVDPDFLHGYDWMREQMAERIEGYSGDYPVWAWLKRPTAKVKGRKNRKPSIRITAMVPKKRILLSDYDRWHSILNKMPCARSEAEFDLLTGECRETWTRVLDFEEWTRPEEIAWLGWPGRLYVQACIDRIYKNEIVSIRSWDT